MINNSDSEKVKNKIESETGGNPAVKLIFETFEKAAGSYGINPDAGGLEFTSTTIVRDHPNRCRLKVWQPEKDRLLAWFYKRSAVPHSRDRFSYGGVTWDLDKIDLSTKGAEINEWLLWLDSGLHPEKRPSEWKSAFPYDIPE